MATLTFTTLRGPWTAGDEGTFVDEVTVEDPSDELVRLAAHAHSAGVIEVSDGLDEGHIETQEQSEAAQIAAQGTWVERTYGDDGFVVPGYWDGPWGVGNLAQHDLEVAQAAVAAAKAGGDEAEIKAAEKHLRKVDREIQGRLAE